MAKIYRVVEVQLRPGVKAEDFEKFMIDEWLPVPKLRNGLSHFGLLKGDKGAGEGKYQSVFVYDSVEARDLYDAGQLPYTADQPLIEARAVLNEKFGAMADFDYTDYAVVGE